MNKLVNKQINTNDILLIQSCTQQTQCELSGRITISSKVGTVEATLIPRSDLCCSLIPTNSGPRLPHAPNPRPKFPGY